jgi:hypothetical protein
MPLYYSIKAQCQEQHVHRLSTSSGFLKSRTIQSFDVIIVLMISPLIVSL